MTLRKNELLYECLKCELNFLASEMNCKITVINDIRHITLFFRMICMDGQNIIRAGLAQWAHSGTEAGV